MNTINLIIEKYNYITENIPEKRKRHNLKSINNFLLHFEEIKNPLEKEQVISLLNDYFDFILNNSIDTNKERQDVYFTFIEPVGLIYKRNASFHYFISPQICIFFWVITSIILFIARSPILLLIGFNAISLAVIIFMYAATKSSRVYRAGW